MPYEPNKPDAPKAATAATPRAAPTTAEGKAQAKAFDEQLKTAKAAVQAAPDSEVKGEAQRDIEAAEALYADGHTERAEAALKQAVVILPKV